MIKLYIFESVADARAFEHPAPVESKPAIVTTADEPTDDAPEERPRNKYTRHTKASIHKKRGVGTGRGKMHCKICGEPGRSDTHPNHGRPPKDVQEASSMPPVASMNPDELREAIHTLQEQGFSSLKIASKLKIKLALVNKYWDVDLVASMSKEDEEADEDADDKDSKVE